MAEDRLVKKNLEIRLKTIEEQLEDIFGRIGLLDEQARQAGYRAWLAMGQGVATSQQVRGGCVSQRDVGRKLTDMRATVCPRDSRSTRVANRRPSHTPH